MYTPQFSYPTSSTAGMGTSSYFGIGSVYDTYNSIPFPFLSCSIDPNYEMVWCASQNVCSYSDLSFIGIFERIFTFQSSVAVLCRGNSKPLHLQYAVNTYVQLRIDNNE